MEGIFSIREFWVEPIYTFREVNYEVQNEQGYVCRLVPCCTGFELSKLDQCLDTEVPEPVIRQISDFILNRDA